MGSNSEMRDVLAAHVERGEVPGLVALVSRRGEIQVDVIGSKAAGSDDPMRRDTLFRISSMSKPDQLTAAQKAASTFAPPDYWTTHGWGLGLAIVTSPDDLTGTAGR
jgi:hypothetical protein